MSAVGDLVNRPVYSMPQVDRVLGLRPGTARRWIDGYERSGREYPPVVREERTGDEVATWGEFVETRLLAEYRDAGVPLIRMRPAVQRLRQELQTRYPLASAKTWLRAEGRELVRVVQDAVRLAPGLHIVVVRNGQELMWSGHADAFQGSLNWTDDSEPQPRSLRPMPSISEVVVDPLRAYGEPVVRAVPTDVIAELVRAGEAPEAVAEMYDLTSAQVDAAIRYELKRAAA